MLKKISIFVILLLITTQIFAQETQKKLKYSGYSGGMMVHTGYLSGGEYNLNGNTKAIDGFPFGIGGAIRFFFGKHLRVGCEGYVSNLHYDDKLSAISLGWGGVLVDYKWDFKRITLYAGSSFGGGSYKHTLNTETQIPLYNEDIFLFRKYPVIVVAPFVGIEFAATQKLLFVAKLDYVMNVSHKVNEYATGPRLYVGIMFNRRKS